MRSAAGTPAASTCHLCPRTPRGSACCRVTTPSGCLDCPKCYNLIQDAADQHRLKLTNLSQTLENIAKTPVVNDEEFDAKMKAVETKIEYLLMDAKSGAGGGDRTLVERLSDLHDRLDNVDVLLQKSSSLEMSANKEIESAKKNFSIADSIIQDAKTELTVHKIKINIKMKLIICDKTFIEYIGTAEK